MSEYIITDKQFKTATEAYLEHELSLPITDVFISGDKLPEIVRCRDCEYSHESESGALYCHGYLTEPWDYYNDAPSMGRKVAPDGFCAWAVKRNAGKKHYDIQILDEYEIMCGGEGE